MYKTFRLIAKELGERIPEIRWIDREKGQLDAPEKFHAVQVPGLLLDFSETIWEGGTGGNQTGFCTLTASLIFRLPTATYEGSEWNDYVEFERLTNRVHEELSALSPIIGDRRKGYDNFTDTFYVTQQSYDLKVYQTKQINIIEKPTPDIQGQIQATLNISQ